MKHYVLPAIACLAIGALVFILVKASEPPRKEPRETPRKSTPAVVKRGRPAIDPPWQGGRTRLEENRWLRDFERALGSKDLKRARWYRQKVCENLDDILASEKLTKNLIEDIAENLDDLDDADRRDVVLPMLRVVRHPDATRLIAEEYYRSRSDAERITLLEAMSHSYHDPEQASLWAIERALNAEKEEHRHRAFEVLQLFSDEPDLVVDTAAKIYSATTRPKQKEQMLEAISQRGEKSAAARTFLRDRIKNARGAATEVSYVVADIEKWGDRRDAADLDALAERYPAMGPWLRDRANLIRRRIRELEQPGAGDREYRERQEEEARRQLEKEKRGRPAKREG